MIKVSAKVLGDALGFPDEHHIVNVIYDQHHYGPYFEFIVEGPSLPEIREGEAYCVANAVVTDGKLSFDF